MWEWVPPPRSDVRFTLGGGGYLRLRNVAVRRPRADARGGGEGGGRGPEGDTADRLQKEEEGVAGASRPLTAEGGEVDELEEEEDDDDEVSFFFLTLVTGPRRSLSLKLSDTRVYAPQIR